MTDQEIIQGLIRKSNVVTQEFFFERCRPLFCKIISHVFTYEVNYDEFVNELYLYLMEDDAQKLRSFEYRCSVYQWLKVLAVRFFIQKRNRMIDVYPKVVHYIAEEPADEENGVVTKSDVQRLLELMPSERYAYVIKKLLIEDVEPSKLACEMEITTANLYNIKHRAMAQLISVTLNDLREYGR